MKRNEVQKKLPTEEKKSTVTFEEDTHIYTTGRNTIEVTVKLRKRKKDDAKSVTLAAATSDQSLKRGSWGDLLSQNQRHIKGSKRISEPKMTKVSKVEKQNKGTQAANIDQDLQRENEFLRNQSATLLEDLNKAKAELKECFTTIKDLRQLSDLLKYENECLTESKNHRLKLEDHLKNTLAENRILKKKIHEVNLMYTQVTTPKDDQIMKFKSAIKEMKSTIDEEIDEMRQKGSSVLGSESFLQQFGIFNSEDMNDSKANDIQRILSSASSMSLRDEEGSSTQYMGVPRSFCSRDNPVEVKRVLAQTDQATQKSSHPIKVSEHVKEYSVQPGERNDGKGFGKGDCLNVEYPLKDSQGLIKLPIHITSGNSSEYLSTSSSTVNESRNQKT